eukprot:CAMPEP_0198242916 /NCGR_PEP_ID=MMETSP1446-20131203/22644_1 /TAXON_ID=1461542 ORGANISM="Unidentified sp, Strain CCMP2111" /NCGR_SAMPLE_ID=MMETSP1446 /ASSEMBLY_ACC=CAM_ASM_001112 /LENGTH=83 /DNA_ID=CAMNT_0043926589 /DNA_START=497 /DNA_END=745 /DNA_ORIENTATION=-
MPSSPSGSTFSRDSFSSFGGGAKGDDDDPPFCFGFNPLGTRPSPNLVLLVVAVPFICMAAFPRMALPTLEQPSHLPMGTLWLQ